MHCRESNPKTQTLTQPLRVQSQSNHVNDYLMVVFIFESIVVTKIGKNFAYLSVTNNNTLSRALAWAKETKSIYVNVCFYVIRLVATCLEGWGFLAAFSISDLCVVIIIQIALTYLYNLVREESLKWRCYVLKIVHDVCISVLWNDLV